MATGTILTSQIPVIPHTKCELCEENDIKWKCFTCTTYQHMCNTCAKVHLKSEHTKNHRVTSMKDSEKRYGQQDSVDDKCLIHTTEDVQIFCSSCDTPICRDCLASGSHRNHELVKFEDIMESKLKELEKMSAENKDVITWFEKNINLTQKIRKDYAKDIKRQTDEINSRNNQLKAKLDQLSNNAIAKLHEMGKRNLETLKCKEEDLKTNMYEIKKLAEQCNDKMSERNIKMIQFAGYFRQGLDKYKSCDPPERIKCPELIYRDIEDSELMEMLGCLKLSSGNVPGVTKESSEGDVMGVQKEKASDNYRPNYQHYSTCQAYPYVEGYTSNWDMYRNYANRLQYSPPDLMMGKKPDNN